MLEPGFSIINGKEFKIFFSLRPTIATAQMRLLGLLITLCIIFSGCRDQPKEGPKIININDGYISNERENCTDRIGVNGKWRLIRFISNNDSSYKNEITISIKDCSYIEYYSSGNLLGKDNFKLYRELKYCDDYQMIFTKNDSNTCINFVKDTMILGACSSYENSEKFKYIFVRM